MGWLETADIFKVYFLLHVLNFKITLISHDIIQSDNKLYHFESKLFQTGTPILIMYLNISPKQTGDQTWSDFRYIKIQK